MLDKPDLTPEMVRCSCGREYATPRVRGRPVVPYCPGCMARMDEAPAAAKDSGEHILATMDALGVNVHRHGYLTVGPHAGELATLGLLGTSNGIIAAQAFVAAVLSAGAWRAVEPLYLHGPTGTGKSQVAACVVRALLEAGTRSSDIVFDRGRAMIIQLQDRYKTGQVDEFGATRGKARVWIYEDAGTEKLTPDAFRVFEDILDRREGRATLMTSNLPREEMANRWADQDGWVRLRSRLGPFNAVKMDGDDLRFRRAS